MASERTNDPKPRRSPTCLDWWRVLRSRPDVAQAYETLISRLRLVGGGRRLKSILVTSVQPGEGKTTVSVNLGLTVIQGGGRALIVDADLRKPRLHSMLELENTRGLADIVAEVVAPRDVAVVVQTVEMNDDEPSSRRSLSVITSGKVTLPASAALGSKHVKEALEVLVEDYDLVLVDSPPLLAVSDALLLAPVVDGALLVLAAGVVREDEARRAKELLEGAGVALVGVVMNHFDERIHGAPLHAYGRSYFS